MNNIQNVVNLIGRTGVNPQIRVFENGKKRASFQLATSETIVEADGKSTKTQWHSVVAWGKTAELIERYVRKGQMLAVGGKLVNRTYKDSSGLSKKITEVQINNMYLISPKRVETTTKLEVVEGTKQKQTSRKAS